jgi:5'-methylthioadenosine phosphorylase
MKIGIIGGSGLDDPDILEDVREFEVKTPYGKPSSTLKVGKIFGIEVVLLARHGRKHEITPSKVNYRANIYALKRMGCNFILASTAVGSLNEEIKRGDLVILDQFIDFTRHRNVTFHENFKKGPVHSSLADPFCPTLRKILIDTAQELGFNYHSKGTVITIEGPRFSTKAESKLFRKWGADVINMSIAPEAILAREADLCYAAIAMNTDYDCWKEDEDPVSWEMVLNIFNKNSDKVKNLFLKAVPKTKSCDFCKKSDVDIIKKDFEKEKFSCFLPGWQEIHSYAKEVSAKIKKSGFYPDIVIGLSRGGLIPARLICDFLHIKNCYTIKVDHWGLTATKDGRARISQGLNVDVLNKKVLIVDDITDTGQSIELSVEHVKEKGANEIKTATLYHLTNSRYTPDFFGLEREWAWIVFPWNKREDLVNIIEKIVKDGEKSTEEIKSELKENFNLEISKEEIMEVLSHKTYLNKVKK